MSLQVVFIIFNHFIDLSSFLFEKQFSLLHTIQLFKFFLLWKLGNDGDVVCSRNIVRRVSLKDISSSFVSLIHPSVFIIIRITVFAIFTLIIWVGWVIIRNFVLNLTIVENIQKLSLMFLVLFFSLYFFKIWNHWPVELWHNFTNVVGTELSYKLLDNYSDNKLVLLDMVTQLLVEKVVDEDFENTLISFKQVLTQKIDSNLQEFQNRSNQFMRSVSIL